MSKHVVVIGGGQGGLSAAIHLRLLGHHVLLLESADGVGGKARGIHQDGYRFDPGPSIIILTEVYRRVFEAAGRRMEDYLRFQRLDPIARVLFEGEDPVDLPASREQCVDLVKHLAPQDARSLETLLQKLDKAERHVQKSVFRKPFHHPWQLVNPHLLAFAVQLDVGRTYKDLVDSWFRSPLLKSFFYGFPSYGGQTYDSKAPGALLIPFYMIRDGVWYPEGGVAAIPAAFERLAVELGVEVRNSCRVTRLEGDAGSVHRAVLESGEAIEADAFVSNVDRLTSERWLGREVNWRPSFSYFTLQWGLDEPQERLSHHSLVVPRSFERGFEELYRKRIFPTEPIVYLNETAGIDPAVAPSGCSSLFAVVTSPAIEDHLDWRRDELLYRQRVVSTLERFGIGVGNPVVERVQTPQTFQERDGNYRGSLYGPDERHRLFGLFPLRLKDERFDNMFYCGGSVQPGAGLPMVTLSGRFVADLV